MLIVRRPSAFQSLQVLHRQQSEKLNELLILFEVSLKTIYDSVFLVKFLLAGVHHNNSEER